MSAPIRVGTSGFAYEDWRGRWYPPDLPRARFFDFYAGVFDALEINATYYRVPPVASAHTLLRTAAGRVQFAIKVPGSITHRRELDGATLAALHAFVDPFAEAGVLPAVLLQFPGAFRPGAETDAFLRRVKTALGPWPLVAELRHGAWDAPGADAILGELALTRAGVDQPAVEGLSASGLATGGGLQYLRLHGRNAADWYSQQSPHARYRYTYTDAELDAVAAAVARQAAGAQSALVFFNNHPEGAAALNAEAMAGRLGLTLRGRGYRDLFSGL